jgi:DNA-binding NarL/FixJ family response regulator
VHPIARRSTPLERVSKLTEELARLETRREIAIAEAMATGASWTQIASALRVSAQAAHKRYRWLRHSPLADETRLKPPLPGT